MVGLDLPIESVWLLSIGIFMIAFLYSSVGHAGASGYIAVMSLFGLSPVMIKPIALALNILVAGITSWQFWRSGHFSWRSFWPFALLSIPFAFLGGYLNVSTQIFKVIVGIILLFSAARFVSHSPPEGVIKAPDRSIALTAGAGLGFMAGLTGTGGGIFLTPLLLLKQWATVKSAAAVSALFILVNSIAGLVGNFKSSGSFPAFTVFFAVSAILGGTIGSTLGSHRFAPILIKRLLAVVLTIAGLKLIFT
jgi:uncharacterized protein